uniref:Putative zinc-binding protein of the histidine triad hit family n=1 Tax=Anopheles marajoara TaxID=58244 RepID=A0A2M4C2H8_9DIPT
MLAAAFRRLSGHTLRPAANFIRWQSSGTTAGGKSAVKDADTIFDKIIQKKIPAEIIYEDEQCLAFNDVSPQGPVHFLVIPKRKIPKLEDSAASDKEILGHLLHVAGQLGKSKAPQGFRLVINNGDHGCQTVYHIHLHVIGGRQLGWPPG